MKKRRQSKAKSADYRILEPRKLLATIDILAAGTTGTEVIQLIVGNEVQQTFDDLGNGAYRNQFRRLTYQTEDAISPGDVRIAFVNDTYTPVNRDVQIDAIVIDGQRFETEHPSVYSTGTWKPEDKVTPGFRESEFLHVNGYFQFANPEPANSPEIFHRNLDPNVGAVVTAFMNNDPQNPNDPWDILTNWKSAVDEIQSVGISEVTFSVYRSESNGALLGGPSINTVSQAVAYANQKGLSVTVKPVFETGSGGWRGDYNPSGSVQSIFRSEYRSLVTQLASIPGIDRMNIGTELNALVNDWGNHGFLRDLIGDAQNAFEQSGNVNGRVGYAANFDSYQNAQHRALAEYDGIEFFGVSAYFSVIPASQANLISSTTSVTSNVLQRMVDNWKTELDGLAQFGRDHNVSVLIQEFGAVQQNYASVAPFAVNPSDWVGANLPNRYAPDAGEQAALYESLIVALDGRKDDFESVVFWTWEHGSSRGERSYENAPANEPRYLEKFAIWPTDGGAGQYLSEFVSNSAGTPQQGIDRTGTEANDTLTGTNLNDSLRGLGGDDVLNGLDGADLLYGDSGNDLIRAGGGNDRVFGGSYSDTIEAAAGDDIVYAGSGWDVVYGDEGDDVIYGEWGKDLLRGGNGSDQIDGGVGSDEIHGDDGRDILSGGDDDDLIYGGVENDQIYGGPGNDRILGGTYSDFVSGDDGDDFISVSSGVDVVYGGNGTDTILGEWGPDKLYGGTGNDYLEGGQGNDLLEGGEQNDYLIGGTQNDQLDGGDGLDTARFNGLRSQYQITTLSNGSLQIEGPDGRDIVTNVEILEFDDEQVTVTPTGGAEPQAIKSPKLLAGFVELPTLDASSLELAGMIQDQSDDTDLNRSDSTIVSDKDELFEQLFGNAADS